MAADNEIPVRKTVTVLYRGAKQLLYNVGMSEVKIATKYSHEMLVEFDGRWAPEEVLALVKDDWKYQAAVLVSTALQKTVTQSELFNVREPSGSQTCWQTRLHLTEEDALKLMTTSGQKSVFVRPAFPTEKQWSSAWTIVWAALPEVPETTLLHVLLGHASRQPGHMGIARAQRNLGLRTPWNAVGPVRRLLRPKDGAFSDANVSLKDEKCFHLTGVPRGVTATEIREACQHLNWIAIPQHRLPSRKDRHDVWWVTAAEPPPAAHFLWQDTHVVIEEVTAEEVRKHKKGENKKPVVIKGKDHKHNQSKTQGVDPLVLNDPWVKHKKMQKDTPEVKHHTSWPASSSSASTIPQGAQATLDPRVTALTQRVESLETDTKQLHGKVDGLDGKVAGMQTDMNSQFAEVLKLLGSIHDKKRAAPDL